MIHIQAVIVKVTLRPLANNVRETQDNVTDINTVNSGDIHKIFWDCFDEVAKENSNVNKNVAEKSSIARELELYLKKARIERNSDPYAWWFTNSHQYPHKNVWSFEKLEQMTANELAECVEAVEIPEGLDSEDDEETEDDLEAITQDFYLEEQKQV
ncbi:hypothetical protein NQ314_016217 [Rhamnusium bicolor]|uniref:HAT C-terminal dimerisation domain-containing protein n=1 Tax=Rhamnusium bicolor TaxID=1586634 RepID=A0AAV8WW69_9CUCU|nr:hypothetical protein NQ314_016217 [Rhamnusium bicolor]